MSELFENLPEVGDRDKPKLVFFFDEAHLLFNEAPPALLEKVEQVVRLIRSKGVGVFFVTQNPLDIPEKVLGQLGNRVQHALRAFTPRDQKAVKSVAETMRANPKIDASKAIMELGVGEALVSFLDAKGTPGITERAWVLAPGSQLGPITPEDRRKLIAGSVVGSTYEKTVDRESAHEQLKARAGGGETLPTEKGAAKPTAEAASGGGIMDSLGDLLFGSTGPRGGRREGVVEAAAKSAARSMGSSIAREISRGMLGGLLGSKRRR
jgi:DNA helicase HerA-like ATPase